METKEKIDNLHKLKDKYVRPKTDQKNKKFKLKTNESNQIDGENSNIYDKL